MSILDIWMNGVFVGKWHQKGRTPSRLVYDPSWVDHPQGRPPSLSLPMTGAGDGLRDAVSVMLGVRASFGCAAALGVRDGATVGL